MLIEREFYLNQIKAAYNILPVTVLIGSRQVGKTSLLNMIKRDLEHIFLNGQDPEIATVFESVSSIETYIRINLNENFSGFVIIDEFQFLSKISTIIKVLTDKHYELKFICSGSSSLDILQNVNESLAGRVRIIEIYSLSWPEYILFNSKELYGKFLKCTKEEDLFILDTQFYSLFYDYLIYGGFPRLAFVKSYTEKMNLLNDIYKTYLLRDVRSYIRNEDSIGFNKMSRMLALQTGNLVNINELSSIHYFRTPDGFEIDFIINDMKYYYGIEAKFKDIKKPSKNPYLKKFISEENIKDFYIVNITLNYHEGNFHYIQPTQIIKYFT